jgi:hypothetical protein
MARVTIATLEQQIEKYVERNDLQKADITNLERTTRDLQRDLKLAWEKITEAQQESDDRLRSLEKLRTLFRCFLDMEWGCTGNSKVPKHRFDDRDRFCASVA